MTNRDDLSKLFDAALHEKEAPSRFGTPESQKKSAPKAFQKKDQTKIAPEKVESEDVSSKPVVSEPEVVAEKSPASAESELIDISKTGDPHAEQAVKSKDDTISAELGAILDEKIRKEKRSKKKARLVALGVLLGITGGASAWVATNPERVEAMKKVVSEIKSAGDIQGMVAEYQKALDKVAVRSEQIDTATESMGVDSSSMDHIEDQGFDKEMREMMGEDGGPTTAQRDKLLRDKFKSVEESGSLTKQEAE